MSIQGKTVVFTGKISKPRHEFQAMVEAHGGIAGSDVTKSTDYLVVGEKPGTKLIRASMLGIPTISEEDFLNLLEEPVQEEVPETNPCGTTDGRHFWFKTTVKDNGDTIKECLCGSMLIQHPNGTWEKHEPRHILEQARKIAHQHAVQAEQECYRKQRLQDEAEKQVIKQLEALTPEDLEQLERQLNEGVIKMESPNGTQEEHKPNLRYINK